MPRRPYSISQGRNYVADGTPLDRYGMPVADDVKWDVIGYWQWGAMHGYAPSILERCTTWDEAKAALRKRRQAR
jgi:hypothetical protein